LFPFVIILQPPIFAVPFYNPSNHFPRKSCNTSNTKLGFFLPKKNIYTLLDPSAIFWFLFFFVFYRYCSEVTNLKYLQTQENENLMNTFILFAFQICFFVHFIIFSKNRPSSIESHLWTPPPFSRHIKVRTINMCQKLAWMPFSRIRPKIFLSFFEIDGFSNLCQILSLRNRGMGPFRKSACKM